ncbi:pyridoxal phosphate-dependent aminotransferase [Kineothrix sp. MSJ-39]|uniref:pyridoxal phosphate-dependent aminotransferase n=1 Tax=Kineothrix sp. MSJ-39 TaxID=2841533 RepID=UPI001C11D251|nr:pyridoxal phosphate-dependent aminotransferase [Kineothrix sp. MSJ-39]MBU5430035.1 pyridoxal phosphate-dependent aminotransferase [Kineothrix sp. MSJ-39]
MISQKYKDMLGQKSVIREMSAAGHKMGEEIGFDNVFDYSLGNPSVPAPKKVEDVIKKLLEETEPLSLHGYSEGHGILQVRKKIAAYLAKTYDIPYTYEDVFMASGAAGALAHAFRAVVCPGEEIITFAPFFPEYRPYIETTGAVLKVVPANTETFQINFEAFEQMITEKTAAVLINTPNNPSGIVYSTETIRKLAEVLSKAQETYGHDIYIISDEPYREIVFSGVDAPCVSQFYDNTIMCYSYSKSLSLPGERIGYVAVNPACKDAALIVHMCTQISRGIGHNCPASLLQLTVAELLGETSDLSVYEENANILYEALTKMGFSCVRPGGTFYMFPKSPEEDAKAFCQKALAYNLVLVPGDSFGCPGFFRISYCVPTEKVKRSLAAFEKLAKEYGLC